MQELGSYQVATTICKACCKQLRELCTALPLPCFTSHMSIKSIHDTRGSECLRETVKGAANAFL